MYLVDLTLQLRNNVLQSVPVLLQPLLLAHPGVQPGLHLSDRTVDGLLRILPVLLELLLHLIPHLLHQDRDVQPMLILVHLSQLRVQHLDDAVRMLQPVVQVTNLLKTNQTLADNRSQNNSLSTSCKCVKALGENRSSNC